MQESWKSKFIEILNGWKNYYFKNEAIEQIAKDRAAVCASCPYNLSNICSLCGCPLSKKTRSETSKCPDGRW